IEAQHAGHPPEVRLQNLADVHAARHTQRVEHDIHGPPVGQERHVLLRNDARHDALVAVTAGHLVANRHLALLRQIDLHELYDARRQFIRLENLVDPLFRLLLDARLLLVGGIDDHADLFVDLAILHAEGLEVDRGEAQVGQDLARESGPRLQRLFHRAGLERELDGLPFEQVDQFHVARVVHAQLLLTLQTAHLADPLAAVPLDHVVVNAREDLHINDHALHAGWHLERGVLHILRLLAEDGGQQLLLGRQLRFALRRDLPDQYVARLHMRADANDTAVVQIRERFFRHVRDLARDLLLTALGIADVQLELLDVDGRVHVILHQALGEHDGILEVVSVPRHECHGDVRAERELPHLGAGAVGEHVALLHALAQPHQRPLVDGRVLIGAPVLLDPVAVVLREPRERRIARYMLPDAFSRPRIHHYLIRGDAGDHAGTPGNHDGAGVPGRLFLETLADDRRAGIEQRDVLTLHVRSQERMIRIVVRHEGNERR